MVGKHFGLALRQLRELFADDYRDGTMQPFPIAFPQRLVGRVANQRRSKK